ncbi:hypothetical protein J5N97_026246 [Dioscorea zingiberensis]|uniref:Uncharacterized protein n=1 Tax=Dioscorea zingiberensis TaxID=325984 RepID=A0A9D5C2M0_9LILI|nr:hypothetical protein J5N97_026246 [Dioscorea zingiberensis]
MERYLVPVDAPRNPKPYRRPRWWRSVLELDGRISSRYRHEASQLILDSYSEIRAFGHHYSIGFGMCPTHMTCLANAVNQNEPISSSRQGISGLEFDSKGIYLASVTKSGCLTVHDFESLYCTTYGPSSSLLEDETKQLLHHSTSQPLGVVRWNPTNQDEVACASRQSNKVLVFDIGYLSSEPIVVLEKGKKSSQQNYERHIGLSDIMFPSADKSRFLSSGLDGVVYGWDRRIGRLPYLELTNNSQTQLTSLQLDIEDRVVFAAGQNGIIYVWDLRGGRTSLAFQSHNEVYYPLLTSFRLSSMLEGIAPLKAQSNIISRGIHSINFDPSCAYQLAFHLYDGWSGVLNLSSSTITHVHCPPPWLDNQEMSAAPSDLRKPSWLPTLSIFAVGSSSSNGLYLLDFFPDSSSACHVNFDEELLDIADENKRIVRNKYLPLSQSVLVCTVHPLNGTIIAGTKDSSLLVVSQKHERV